MKTTWGVSGVMLALSACQDGTPRAAEPTANLAQARVPSTRLTPPAPLLLEGAYVHPGSGIAFPETAAGFLRVEPRQYDHEGNDVGIGYRRFWTDAKLMFRAEITVFVFPWQKTGLATPDELFEGEADAIRKAEEDVREIRRVDSEARHGGSDARVSAAEFAYRGSERMGRLPMIALLAAFNDGPWRVTVRATLPPPRRDECVAALEQLLAALELPPTGLPATTN